MRRTNPFLQGVVILAAAAVIALGSNAVASRERKLVLPGYYPDAMRLPQRPPEPAATLPAAPAAPPPTVTTASPLTVPPSPAAPATQPILDTMPKTTTARPVQAATPKTDTARPATAPPASTQRAPNVLERFRPHPEKAYVEISGADAVELHDAGALVLDARRSSVFAEGHIASARPFSVWESDIDEKVNALYAERSDPREQGLPIVVYCSGGECEDSHMLAQKLWGVGFNNVLVYKDGFPDWLKRGGPIDRGAKP